jgi:hypothetical protein
MMQKPDKWYRFVFVALVVVFLFQIVTLGRIVIDSAVWRKPASTDPISLKDYISAAEARAADPYPVYHFQQIAEDSSGVLYAISNGHGLLVSFNEGGSWIKRNSGLPSKVVYPFEKPILRHLTSLGVDSIQPGRVAVTTPDEVYLSENYGITWEKVPTHHRDPKKEGWPKPYTYFTSVSFSQTEKDSLIVGTSFDGFYKTSDRGQSWSDPSEKAFFLIRGANFYREVAGIAFDPVVPDSVIVGCGFGGGIYRWNPLTEEHLDLEFPGEENGETIRGLNIIFRNPATKLQVVTDTSVWHFDFGMSQWQQVPYPHLINNQRYALDRAKAKRLELASDKRGIYISAYGATTKHYDSHLQFAVEHGLNSVVIDFKDDYGILTYNTALELPRKIGAVQELFNAQEVINKAHNLGIYVIARILVFKDRAMYRYDNHRYAAWDRTSNWAWANLFEFDDEETKETKYYQKEHWVDPFAEFIWDYNLEVAKELQDLGVDEIQFDYIRFPTDGDLSKITYRHQKAGMNRMDALESFLRKAREVITVPISTDLYGFNSWHRMGNWNGQSIEMVCDYVDVIAPMFYPSHFPRSFLRKLPYLERAELIYREGTERALNITRNRSIIRPYIQAFLIGNEANMSRAEYSDYLKKQLQGTLKASSSGFTLWNAANDYYMVTFSLSKDLLEASLGHGNF